MPVDFYVGGVEHAVLHLLYARFWQKVLYDAGLVTEKEPFHKLVNQGMITSYSYQDANGKYYYPKEIEKRGIRDKIKLKKGVIGSERWSDKMRKRISEGLGIELYDIYGLTEIYGPGIGINCKYNTGMHCWDDYLYIEIIDPKTLRPVPDGEFGEIVITTLVKEGAPLIRYRTHDLSRIIPGECPCGSKHPRLDTIMGRTDDMMKIKGVNVFPSPIEEILQAFPEVSSEYQIRISHLDGKDTMRIYVETNGSVNFLDLADRIAVKVKSKIGFTPLVKVVENGVLPRSEKKTKRVIDERYD